jgi:hypothetical protein
MRTSQRNRIRAIATPAGLAYALAWNGGVQNSCVQLVRLDKEKLKLIEGLLKKLNNSLNKILARCNDVFFFQPPSSQHKIVTAQDIEKAQDLETKFQIRVFAYSKIGSGSTITFRIDGDAKVEISDETLDADQEEYNNDNDNDNDCALGSDSTTDFIFGDTTVNKDNVVLVDDGPDDANDGDDMEHPDDANDDDDMEHEVDLTVVPKSMYEIVRAEHDRSAMVVTGVKLLRKSTFSVILGPRDANRKPRKRILKTIENRRDLVAQAVRFARHSIDSHDIVIRDGHDSMEEWKLSETFETKPRPMGWARRPSWGKCYGAKYLANYLHEIKELFLSGVKDSSAKKGPSQMHEELRHKHRGKYSIPSESEIRTAISTLFQRQKTSGVDIAEVTEDGIGQGKRGRKSAIPPDVLEFIDAHVGQENTTNAVLKLVRQKYGQQIRAVGPEENFVTDAQIKNRCNNIKSSLKAKVVL